MANKFFTDKSLATFVDEIKTYTNDAVSNKADNAVIGTITYNADEQKYTCDKTYDELYNAYLSGTTVALKDNVYIYSCVGCENSILSFTNLLDKTSVVYRVYHNGYTNTDMIEETYTMFINAEGDTMYGTLTLSSDPTENLHAATKQYVDNKVSSVNTDSYSKSEIDNALSNKANSDHNHDTEYDALGSAENSLTEAKDYVDERVARFLEEYPVGIVSTVNDEGVLYFSTDVLPDGDEVSY